MATSYASNTRRGGIYEIAIDINDTENKTTHFGISDDDMLQLQIYSVPNEDDIDVKDSVVVQVNSDRREQFIKFLHEAINMLNRNK